MIRAATRRLVRSIYVMRCGYCAVSEAEIGAELTCDHFYPQSKGGSDEPENLVYACHACNEFKGDTWGEDESTRLLHPLRDELSLHLEPQVDGTMRALTSEGQKFIEVLHLNRPPLVLRRQNEQRMERVIQHYEAISERLDEIMARMPPLEERARRKRKP